MNLDDAQKKKVSEWIAQGAKVSEIQTRLEKELGVRLTYMEVRFLMDDLKLTPKDSEPPKPPPNLASPATPTKSSTPAPDTASQPLKVGSPVEDANAAGGGVSVVVDKVTRPGALVSGKVTFSDGQQADWYLDQMGRLGVVPKVQGYKPTQADVQDFQLALQDELAKMGF